MTFNSSQQERLLTALERIADATERLAAHADAWAKPIRIVVPDEQVMSQDEARRRYGMPPVTDADPHSTKGPYR